MPAHPGIRKTIQPIYSIYTFFLKNGVQSTPKREISGFLAAKNIQGMKAAGTFLVKNRIKKKIVFDNYNI